MVAGRGGAVVGTPGGVEVAMAVDVLVAVGVARAGHTCVSGDVGESARADAAAAWGFPYCYQGPARRRSKDFH